ncbi:MAG: sulfatase-like hydrolase/transferase [Planctomycetota bacterium]
MRVLVSHAFLAVLPVAFSSVAVAAEGPPNIVVILADDLGYADLGCQGCTDIPTPHIDSIAESGVRCTSGYATHPVCSPSRAGLLSGMYQHRFGFEHNSGPERYAAENFGLPRNIPTLAEKLKAAGYATGMVGKWHIGFKEGLRPHERGFDYHYGFLSGAHNYLPDQPDNDSIIRNGVPVTDEKEYLTDAFGRESAAFIERSKGGRFFLYLAFNAVHAPLQATSQYESRFPQIEDRERKTYAGMLTAMDDAVGRVLETLRKNQLEQNTLIVFYSDNGGPTAQTTSRNDPLRGYKGQVLEGGIRVPFLIQWKGKLPGGKVFDPMVMGFDVHATALAAAGIVPAADKRLDGVDLVPFLTGERSGVPHETLFWRAGPQRAVRAGNWKLLQALQQPPQLYNLRDDIGESTDLAAKQPEKLKELEAIYTAWDDQMMPAQWIRQDARTEARRSAEGAQPRQGAGRRGAAALATVEERFRESDTNGDGKLLPSEYPQTQVFERMDANSDGVVTLEEAQEAFRRRAATRGEKQ